jgi:hypothetical protein
MKLLVAEQRGIIFDFISYRRAPSLTVPLSRFAGLRRSKELWSVSDKQRSIELIYPGKFRDRDYEPTKPVHEITSLSSFKFQISIQYPGITSTGCF